MTVGITLIASLGILLMSLSILSSARASITAYSDVSALVNCSKSMTEYVIYGGALDTNCDNQFGECVDFSDRTCKPCGSADTQFECGNSGCYGQAMVDRKNIRVSTFCTDSSYTYKLYYTSGTNWTTDGAAGFMTAN